LTWTIISAILAAGGLILLEWLRTRNSKQEALEVKNETLEKLAAEKRAKEEAADAQTAKEILASGDAQRAIGFLRDSWPRPKDAPPVSTP
jgi:hypothetical protein